MFPYLFSVGSEANVKQCVLFVLVDLPFIYCLSVLYGMKRVLFVFPIIQERGFTRPGLPCQEDGLACMSDQLQGILKLLIVRV